jgi:uncharacterized membrane protein YfcA
MEAHFLGVPDVNGWIFAGLMVASMCTSFCGVAVGAAGGLVLLAILAMVFPPGVLIPVHTVVMLGSNVSRLFIMWRWILRDTLLPFLVGAVIGAAAGARIFVSLPTPVLQGILGGFILLIVWMPKMSEVGGLRRRFAVLGFGATFLGMFVSATGAFLAPFVAGAAPDRRNYAATFAALMLLVHGTKLAAFGLLGVAIGAYLPLLAAMVATSAIGNWLGRIALEKTPENVFRLAFKVILSLLAIRLLWVAARASGWL